MRAAGLPTDRWAFATEDETADRLRRAGFADVQVWSRPEPVDFATRRDLEEFLETVILVEAMADVPLAHRRATVTAVADGLPSRTIDYVRINVDAVVR
jgi:hypothetical protein